MSLTIPILVPGAGTLNLQSRLPYAQATQAAEGTVVPIVYGEAQIGGRIFAAKYNSTTGLWTVGVLWCVGQCNAIVQAYINGAVPVAGVSVTHYLGTTSQTADPLLAAEISGYADTLIFVHPTANIGLCYSVFQYSNLHYSSLPQFLAQIQGRLVYQPSSGTTIYSASPALALRDLITSVQLGLGQAINDTTVTAVQTACVTNVISTPRRVLGLIIDNAQPTTAWIDILSMYAGCWAFKRGATWQLIPDRPRSSDATLTKDDVVANSLTIALADSSQVPTVVRIAYTDTSTTIWREREAIAELAGVSSGTVPRRESFIKMPGVTRYSQAKREAQERLDKLQRTLSCQFTGFDEQLARETGDVITITHPYGLSARTMRLVADPHVPKPGRVVITAVDYDASDYDDTEATATYGAADGVLGDATAQPEPGSTAGGGDTGEITARNGNFELGDRYWTKGGTFAIANDPANAHRGNWVAKITGAGGAAALTNAIHYPMLANVPVVVGGFIKVSGGYTGGNPSWRATFLDSAGATISSVGTTPAAPTSWTGVRKVTVSPANTHFVVLEAYMPSSQSAGTAYFDDGFIVFQGSMFGDTVIDATGAVIPDLVISSGDSFVVFSYDGTDYQQQRATPVYYTYDGSGTYKYKQGSAAADADREFPWIDSDVKFWRNTTLIKTFTFRHFCQYGSEASNSRVGSLVRSIWRLSAGSESDGSFTVDINTSTNRSVWNGATVVSTNTYEEYLSANYGGNAGTYAITITHIASGAVARIMVSLTPIASAGPVGGK